MAGYTASTGTDPLSLEKIYILLCPLQFKKKKKNCLCVIWTCGDLNKRLQMGSPGFWKFHIQRVAAALISRANGEIVTECLLSLDNPWRQPTWIWEQKQSQQTCKGRENQAKKRRFMRGEKTLWGALKRPRRTSVLEGRAVDSWRKKWSSSGCGPKPSTLRVCLRAPPF